MIGSPELIQDQVTWSFCVFGAPTLGGEFRQGISCQELAVTLDWSMVLKIQNRKKAFIASIVQNLSWLLELLIVGSCYLAFQKAQELENLS